MLHEGWNMPHGASEELEVVQHDIRKREDEVRSKNNCYLHESYPSRSKLERDKLSSTFSFDDRKKKNEIN
jgi:hypothetical protein